MSHVVALFSPGRHKGGLGGEAGGMATMTEVAKRDVLATTPLFAALARDEVTALAGLAKERRVAKDAAVVHRGDRESSMLILVNGRLRVGTVSAEGREITIGTITPGGVVGEIALLDGQPRSMDVTAMVDSVLLVVERSTFLPFLRARPDLMLRLMALLCDRLRKASKAFEDVALAPLSGRLARLLLTLAEEHGVPGKDGTRIRLKISQRDMSAQVAATRERVNKQLRQWHEQGVLGEEDSDIVIRRRVELEALLEGGSLSAGAVPQVAPVYTRAATRAASRLALTVAVRAASFTLNISSTSRSSSRTGVSAASM